MTAETLFSHTTTINEAGFNIIYRTTVTVSGGLQTTRTTKNSNGVITVVSSVAIMAGTVFAAQKLAEVKARFGVSEPEASTVVTEDGQVPAVAASVLSVHQMIQDELTAAGLVMGDLTKPGWMHTLSNGRCMWVQAGPPEVLEDLFGATKQSSLTMTVLCPDCCGQTHTIFTMHGDYRQCDADRTHERVRVR